MCPPGSGDRSPSLRIRDDLIGRLVVAGHQIWCHPAAPGGRRRLLTGDLRQVARGTVGVFMGRMDGGGSSWALIHLPDGPVMSYPRGWRLLPDG